MLAVWIIALVVIVQLDSRIPLAMLAIATVFFILLLPAMNDLVRSMDRLMSGHSERTRDSNNRTGEH